MVYASFVVLSTIIYRYDKPSAPEILLETHRDDCNRVASDDQARIVRRGIGDPIKETIRLKRLILPAQDEAYSRNRDAAHEIRRQGEDSRLVTGDGTEPEFFGDHIGGCLRGGLDPCFIPAWADSNRSGDYFGPGTYRDD